MTDISAEKVRELREKSGAGIMECKRALSATGGDLSQAIDFLRKEGVVKAAKKAGRVTQEGLIAIAYGPDRKSAALVEVDCETDFVARTDSFQAFLAAVAEHVVKQHSKGLAKDLDSLMAQPFSGTTLKEALSNLIAKIGENMAIRRFQVVSVGEGESLGAYLHAGSKIGVLVKLRGTGGERVSLPDLARDVAMHVAAMSPRFLARADVPADVVAREREIARESPDLKGKPANILDKIIDGKLNRFFSENCLVEQPFIKDPTGKKTVAGYLKETAPGTEIVQTVRFQVGEDS